MFLQVLITLKPFQHNQINPHNIQLITLCLWVSCKWHGNEKEWRVVQMEDGAAFCMAILK